MLNVDGYETRLACLNFKYTYGERTKEIARDVAVLEAACLQVQSSEFHKLLEMILLLGNYLNSNSNKAMARGFKINTLNKASSHFTLMTFLKSFASSLWIPNHPITKSLFYTIS